MEKKFEKLLENNFKLQTGYGISPIEARKYVSLDKVKVIGIDWDKETSKETTFNRPERKYRY